MQCFKLDLRQKINLFLNKFSVLMLVSLETKGHYRGFHKKHSGSFDYRARCNCYSILYLF